MDVIYIWANGYSNQGQHEQTSSSLESKEKREDWEDTFNHAYIQPVLKVNWSQSDSFVLIIIHFILFQEKDSKLKLTIEAAITGEAQGNNCWLQY